MYTLEWFQCRVVPNVSGISEQIFFSVIKKNWWHSWHSGQNRLKVLVLLTNSCATTSISHGTAWHKWRKYWLFCNYALAHSLLGARDLFCFFENFFAQKFHYTL